jgi:hypothetical protein
MPALATGSWAEGAWAVGAWALDTSGGGDGGGDGGGGTTTPPDVTSSALPIAPARTTRLGSNVAPVDIANRALQLIGQDRISSLEQGTKAARMCSENYAHDRDAELRAHRWTFAMERISLPADAYRAPFEYAYRYALPVDFLHLDMVGDCYVGASLTDYRVAPEVDYAIEGGYILSDTTAPLDLRYVRRMDETGLFDPLFVDVLAHRLALTLCIPITQDLALRDRIERGYERAVLRAVRANAVEKAPEPTPDDSWVLSRR